MTNRKLQLLIVDDDAGFREVLQDIFAEREDIYLTQADSGSDALEKVQTADFDLVLLDMRMPSGTEGLDALHEIKKLKPQIEVIMVTGYGDIETAVEAMKRGAKDFVPKSPKDFKDRITFKVNDFIRTAHLIADRELLIQAKYQETLTLTNSQAKGKVLEELVSALLESVGGFIEIGRDVNTATEEIDLVFRNDSREPAWHKESQIILVECKNWHSQRVGKNEFVLFKEKMENRAGRCKLGFLVCTEDFAVTVEKEMLRSSKFDSLVVPINGAQLRELVEAGRERSQRLRELVDRALLI